MEIIIACLYCIHFNENSELPKCEAFPKGIPEEVWSGKNDHTKFIEGDGGILFELKNK